MNLRESRKLSESLQILIGSLFVNVIALGNQRHPVDKMLKFHFIDTFIVANCYFRLSFCPSSTSSVGYDVLLRRVNCSCSFFASFRWASPANKRRNCFDNLKRSILLLKPIKLFFECDEMVTFSSGQAGRCNLNHHEDLNYSRYVSCQFTSPWPCNVIHVSNIYAFMVSYLKIIQTLQPELTALRSQRSTKSRRILF